MFFLTQLPENPQYEHFYANVSNPKWDPSSGLMNDDKRRVAKKEINNNEENKFLGSSEC